MAIGVPYHPLGDAKGKHEIDAYLAIAIQEMRNAQIGDLFPNALDGRH